jgi:hypothetical protein
VILSILFTMCHVSDIGYIYALNVINYDYSEVDFVRHIRDKEFYHPGYNALFSVDSQLTLRRIRLQTQAFLLLVFYWFLAWFILET